MYSLAVKNAVKSFVDTHGDEIIKGITNTDLFFPAVVAQLALESQWGRSGLASKYNNYGGIKDSTHPNSGEVDLGTKEVSDTGKVYKTTQTFATYPDFKTFMEDYTRILDLKRYQDAGVKTATDPSGQLLAIAKGGYSTRDPQDYVKRGSGIMEAVADLYPYGKISSQGINNIDDMKKAAASGLFAGSAALSDKFKNTFNK